MKCWRELAMAACLLLTGCGGVGAGVEKAPAQEGPPVEQVGERLPEEVWESPGKKEEQPEVSAVSGGWREAYVAFLEKKAAQAAWLRDPENPDYDPNWTALEVSETIGPYVLYDIDQDELPELMMRYGAGEAGYHTAVYGYVDGGVVELGEIPSGHSSFYTCPGDNGVIRNWGHMGVHFVEKISLAEGKLLVETIFEEGYAAGGEEALEYVSVAEIVPGSVPLWENRPTVTLPEFGALTLPIYDCGKDRAAQPLDPDRDEAAKTAIEAVLTGKEAFYGVTADGFGGDTGWITMGEYLQPGGITEYAGFPLRIAAKTWEDFNGDGQREALVTIGRQEGDPYSGVMQVVFSLDEAADIVFAYCLNYMDPYKIAGTAFVSKYDGTAFGLAFEGYESYLYTVK